MAALLGHGWSVDLREPSRHRRDEWRRPRVLRGPDPRTWGRASWGGHVHDAAGAWGSTTTFQGHWACSPTGPRTSPTRPRASSSSTASTPRVGPRAGARRRRRRLPGRWGRPDPSGPGGRRGRQARVSTARWSSARQATVRGSTATSTSRCSAPGLAVRHARAGTPLTAASTTVGVVPQGPVDNLGKSSPNGWTTGVDLWVEDEFRVEPGFVRRTLAPSGSRA